MITRDLAHRARDIGLQVVARRPLGPIADPDSRIVIVRPDHFGDMLMLGPAIRFLEQVACGHKITLMIGPWNEAVARHMHPNLDLLVWDFPGFSRDANRSSALAPYREITNAAQEVRALRPQAICLMRDDHWWGAWMAREAGVPIRVGYDHNQLRPFLTHPSHIAPVHYVQQNVELMRRLTAILGHDVDLVDSAVKSLSLFWPDDERAQQSAQSIVSQHSQPEGYFVVHPGSGAPVKLWPPRRWAALIDRVTTETGRAVFLTGAPHERALCDEIATLARSNPVNLAGKTTLFTLAEIFRAAALVVGVDSGPLHLATAVQRPTIHLYGPSDHVRYGPWGDNRLNRIIAANMTCPECGNLSTDRPAGCGCMTAIQSEDVSQVAIEMLANE